MNSKSDNQIHVLVAPLDWGLGHATRCIPIIDQLQKKGCKVSVASSGRALALLKREFPLIDSFELYPYNPQYQTSGSLLLKVILQAPKFLKAIFSERKQVEEIIKEQSIKLIISDNRYGCYSSSVRSVFITHQLTILNPSQYFFVARVANWLNQWRIKKFDECWVPDLPQNEFSGSLSKSKTVPHQFIGLLSRFSLPIGERMDQVISQNPAILRSNKLLVILSGPEPQRTVFENIILTQAKKIDGNVLISKGLPEESDQISISENIRSINHLTTADLQLAIQQAEYVICRSGYSSVMDLATIGKKNIIMVPTPGQPEQEYLAEKLNDENKVYAISQSKLNLKEALVQASKTIGLFAEKDELLDQVLSNAISMIKQKSL